MRHSIIIKIVLLISCIARFYGQSQLEDSLLFYEYKYYKCDNDSVKQNILVKKIQLYFNAGFTNVEVFHEIKRVDLHHLKKGKTDFLWNAALIAYINNEHDYAMFFTKEYETATNDTSISANLLKFLVYKYNDTLVTHKILKALKQKDPQFACLTCFENISAYQRKHLNLYLLSSAILPGSGTAFNGYILKGMLSLAIMSASVYGIVNLVEYGLYLNAALWGTGVGLKFYAGNINLTEQSFYKAETKQKNKLTTSCELQLKNILDQYPLMLK